MSIGEALLWTTGVELDPMTMKQFVSRYRNKLPVVVSVVDGYFGCYGQEIGSNETYWINSIARQKRILVRDRCSRCFSIPLDYKIMFHIATDTNQMSKTVMPLRDAMAALDASTPQLSVRKLLLHNDQAVTVGFGAKRTKFGRLGVLEVVDTYELEYLLARSIYDDNLDSRILPIPVFMDLTFSVAIGCRHGSEQEFHDWKTQISVIENSFKQQDAHALCNEIIFFDQKPDEELDEGSYEYMRPMDVICADEEHDYEPIAAGDKHLFDELAAHDAVAIASLDDAVASLELIDASFPESPTTTHGRRPEDEPTGLLPYPPLRPGALGGGENAISRSMRQFRRSHSNRSFVDDSSTTTTSPPPPPVPVRQQLRAAPPLGRRIKSRSNPSTPRSSPPPPPLPRHLHSPPPPPPKRSPLVASGRSSVPAAKSTTAGVASASASSAAAGAKCHLRDYLFASDVPRDVDFATVSKSDLAHCLCLLNMWSFAQTFEERDVDGKLLLALNEDALTAEFGFKPSDARKLMKFAKHRWRPSPRKSRPTE